MEDTKEKRFVGLDGLKRFWTKAKTWIAGQITAEVTAKIAEIVANAPEDLDTLKEIADWISAHVNDAAAMNTQINTNKNNIAALQTSVAGKAAASHTHDDRYFTETEVTNKLDSIKTIMKPNYTTGKLPAGVYPYPQTGSISASIVTTRGNPVFITYSGDFVLNSCGNIATDIWFELYVDNKLLQRTAATSSHPRGEGNTTFAGSALAVLSAGSHTIKLNQVWYNAIYGYVLQFQEHENYVNLVAFEL